MQDKKRSKEKKQSNQEWSTHQETNVVQLHKGTYIHSWNHKGTYIHG